MNGKETLNGSRLENVGLYEPIIFDRPTGYCPIEFDNPDAPGTPLPPEEAVTPSFCRVEDAQEPSKPEPAAQPPILPSEQSKTVQAALAEILMPHVNQSLTGEVLAAEPVKPEQSNGNFIPATDNGLRIKATDVLAALKAKLTLRVVDNVLYAYAAPVYRVVDKETMHRLIMRTCRQYVHAVGNASIIRQVYDLICADDEIASTGTRPAEHLVALENGLLDLHTMTSVPASPDIFVTALIRGNFLWDQLGNCFVFQRFLNTVTGGDPLLEQRIWEMIGYILVPDTQGKCFFLLQGVPDSGKSLLGNLIASFFEDDAVTSLDLTALGQQFAVSDLVGKRLCTPLDLAASPWSAQAIGVLKSLTGNDLVTADVKYQPRIKFRNTASFLFATNHAITTAVRDDAILRRMISVPFRYTIPRDQQDHQLLERLRQEKDAIITRAIQAYWNLKKNNYKFSGNYHVNEAVSIDLGMVSTNLDQAVADFFYQRCVLDSEAVTFLNDLHTAFQSVYPAFADSAVFSAKFFSFLENAFPGRVSKTRKRKPGAQNATSAFQGLRLN